MKMKIAIDLGNAAFSDGNSGHECARILRELADKIEWFDIARPDPNLSNLRDINGNTVGKATVTR